MIIVTIAEILLSVCFTLFLWFVVTYIQHIKTEVREPMSAKEVIREVIAVGVVLPVMFAILIFFAAVMK